MRRNGKIALLVFSFILVVTSCLTEENNSTRVNDSIHAFYYTWFGNPEFDGSYSHWNHKIVPHGPDPRWIDAGAYSGIEDIGANYYPELGTYSSNDPTLIRKHMEMMQTAGIGVVVISWWGANDYARNSLPVYFDLASEYGLKIAFHIEPIFQTTAQFKSLLTLIVDQFGQHPAYYQYQGKPIYYVYDSYKVPAQDWKKILDPDEATSIRNTQLDGHFIGIWTLRTSRDFFLNSGFDGIYTYYASEKYMWASNPNNWPEIAEFAKDNNLLFSPSVGPGYIDTRIRPWNVGVTIERDQGAYYEQMFEAAREVNPTFISITSFNEWHEGTQIEPAIPKSTGDYNYEDYGKETDPWYYLHLTKKLIDSLKR